MIYNAAHAMAERRAVGPDPESLCGRAHSGRPGRKPIATQQVLEAVLWILNTGAQWHMLPQGYPKHKTVHRRFQQRCRDDVLREVLTDLANTLRERGATDERESFIDAMFSPAKGSGDEAAPSG